MSLHGDHEHGAAWRRLQRRLRIHWRHEQLTLQMFVATYEYHAAPRRQMMARSGEWGRDVLHGQVPEHPTAQAAGTQYFAMDVDEVPATGSRPDRLAGVRPQRVQQHSADQIVDTAPALPILDVPVPLMGEQLVDVLRFFDTLCPVAEVIDVPKIPLEDIPARRLCREPQLVEQLVEVPTVVSYSSLLQRTVEQHVDIPVPRGRGRLAGLQGSSPGQSSTAFVEQIVHIPGGGLQGFRPRQGSTASSSFSPAGSDDDADELGIGVFSHFSPVEKSAKVTSHSSQRVLRSVSSSELSAHQMPRVGPAAHSRPSDERITFVDAHDHARVRMDTVHGSYWKNLDTQHSQWHPPWEG